MDNQPTYEIDSDGTKKWVLNGKFHRIDGPAIEYTDGSYVWYLNDKRHRVDGPAMEYPSSHKKWYINGVLHRVGGPAVEYPDGTKKWYLNGVNFSFEDFLEKIEDEELKLEIVLKYG